ncbi:MAG: hypothetical protein K1X85_04895 [Ignavibacteria bacterium]|nr:hypothetical protein [Ignavibacteria bacterium]
MALESLENTYEEFIKFKNEILAHNNHFNLRKDICEDLFQDTVIVFLKKYDENRGNARAFFVTIFKNKLIDFVKRDRFNKVISIVTIQEEADEIPDTEDTEIFVPDGFNSIHHFVASLKKVLSDEEKEFLNTLSKVITDASGHGLISEVARELNIEPNKGWNIWRRIVRKAKKHATERKEAHDRSEESGLILREPITPMKSSDLRFQLPIKTERIQQCIPDEVLEMLKFDQLNFISPVKIRRLLEIFSKEFFPDSPKSP